MPESHEHPSVLTGQVKPLHPSGGVSMTIWAGEVNHTTGDITLYSLPRVCGCISPPLKLIQCLIQ